MKQSDSDLSPGTGIVLCTCPDRACANRLARGLVEERLAACVNIAAGIRSVFRWQDEVQEDAEILLVMKTSIARFPALESWLRANHPYDVPEILLLPVADGSEDYLQWIIDSVAEDPGD